MAVKTLFANPDSAEREYTRKLLRYARELAANVERELIPELEKIAAEYAADARRDAWTDTLAALIAELDRLGAAGAVTTSEALPTQFSTVSKFNEAQFKMVVKANTGFDLPPVMPGAPKALLGLSVFRDEPFLVPLAQGWIAENTSLIKSLPTRLNPELEGIIRRGVMGGASVRDLKEQLRARYGVTEYRATLIAQDQTLKLNADLTRERLTSVGVDQYIWRSVQDSRVRPEHVEYNGRTYAFTKPPPDGNPGRPVRCRCRPEAVWPEEIAKPTRKPRAKPAPEPVALVPEPTRKPSHEAAFDAVAAYVRPAEITAAFAEYAEALADRMTKRAAFDLAGRSFRGPEWPALDAAQRREAAAEIARDAARKKEETTLRPLMFVPEADRVEASRVVAGDVALAYRKNVRTAADIISRMIHKSRAPRVRVTKATGPMANRAYYWNETIHIQGKTPVSTVVHEMVHDIEARYPEILQRTKAFLAKRAKGQAARRLLDLVPGSKYKPHEVAFEDEFAKRGGADYMGKLYPDATELLTMGIERMLADAKGFLERDPEYFRFLLEIFHGV